MAVLVDARGMRCPWPALRLAKAMRARPDGGVTLLADDPAAAREVAALAAEHGWTVDTAGEARFEVRVRPAARPVTPPGAAP